MSSRPRLIGLGVAVVAATPTYCKPPKAARLASRVSRSLHPQSLCAASSRDFRPSPPWSARQPCRFRKPLRWGIPSPVFPDRFPTAPEPEVGSAAAIGEVSVLEQVPELATAAWAELEEVRT